MAAWHRLRPVPISAARCEVFSTWQLESRLNTCTLSSLPTVRSVWLCPVLIGLNEAQFNPEGRDRRRRVGTVCGGVDLVVELKWWPIVVVGLACLIAATSAAALLPMARTHRVLRPLAHVDRLTRLPEYVRVYRIYFFSVILTGALLIAVFVTALTASARPTGMSSSTQAFETAHPEDVMLCVGEPVGDPTTAGFFNYYADYARSLSSLDTQRIGLTSTTLRVIPLTRDYRYATDRLRSLAKLARIQQDLDTRKPVSDADRDRPQGGDREFLPAVDLRRLRPQRRRCARPLYDVASRHIKREAGTGAN